MARPRKQQLEINFSVRAGEEGYRSWRETRRQAMHNLSAQMGLPLGRRVEVCLRGGIVLKGLLQLRGEKLFIEETRDFTLELVVDGVAFTAAEIESCVRLD